MTSRNHHAGSYPPRNGSSTRRLSGTTAEALLLAGIGYEEGGGEYDEGAGGPRAAAPHNSRRLSERTAEAMLLAGVLEEEEEQDGKILVGGINRYQEGRVDAIHFSEVRTDVRRDDEEIRAGVIPSRSSLPTGRSFPLVFGNVGQVSNQMSEYYTPESGGTSDSNDRGMYSEDGNDNGGSENVSEESCSSSSAAPSMVVELDLEVPISSADAGGRTSSLVIDGSDDISNGVPLPPPGPVDDTHSSLPLIFTLRNHIFGQQFNPFAPRRSSGTDTSNKIAIVNGIAGGKGSSDLANMNIAAVSNIWADTHADEEERRGPPSKTSNRDRYRTAMSEMKYFRIFHRWSKKGKTEDHRSCVLMKILILTFLLAAFVVVWVTLSKQVTSQGSHGYRSGETGHMKPPKPPTNLAKVCSPLIVHLGSLSYEKCRDLCYTAECCFLQEWDPQSCQDLGKGHEWCIEYKKHCVSLDMENTLPREPPIPPNDLAKICSASGVTSSSVLQDHKQCKELCDKAECCFLPDWNSMACHKDSKGKQGIGTCTLYKENCIMLSSSKSKFKLMDHDK